MSTTTADHADALRLERRLLLFSAACAAVFAVVGIAWGLIARSQIILFDGVYAIIGLVLSSLSLRASALVERGPTPHYPFGREALAPLIVGVQGLVLLGTFGYAAIDAVLVIVSGGGDASIGSGFVYAVITLVLSVAIWRLLKSRGHGSELVGAEAAQWAAGVLLSLAMMIGFAIALVLQRTAYAWLADYMDPALVLVSAVLFLPTPIAMLKTMYKELLEAAPAVEISGPIHAVVADVSAQYGLPEPTARIGKLGRKVYIELDYVVEQGRWSVAVADLVRRDLMAELHKPGQLLWLNVELHTDPEWDRAPDI